ncbi:MAG: hypothetical protein IJR39_03465 [Treponema sp.]|nr:hypothetical protein [Treponema sp.]
MKKLFKLQALLAAILMAFSFASCSGDDDDDDSPSTTTYTGSFSLAGTNYTTLNIMSDGNYTMTGDSDTDRGTWVLASARAVAVGDYIFTSTVHKASDGTNGTFSVSITSTSVTMETGTLTASGTGIVVKKSSGSAPLAGVFVQEEEKKMRLGWRTMTSSLSIQTAHFIRKKFVKKGLFLNTQRQYTRILPTLQRERLLLQ